MFKLSDLPKERFDEIMGHIGQSQGNDLKSLLEQALMEKQKKDMPMDQSPMGSDMDDKMPMDKPKGIAIEKISVSKDPMSMDKANPLGGGMKGSSSMGMDDSKGDMPDMDDKMSGDDEMSNDELKELLSKYLSE